jgi:predicted  nucleic acid-binding Zn-ribbon protein
MEKVMNTGVPITVAALALLAGCAATPEAPHQALARAEASIENAEQSGARQFGTEELDAAREHLSQARAAVEREEMIVAERYAERAALDAELATAMARNHKAQESVRELNESIEVLREEIARNRALAGERQ